MTTKTLVIHAGLAIASHRRTNNGMSRGRASEVRGAYARVTPDQRLMFMYGDPVEIGYGRREDGYDPARSLLLMASSCTHTAASMPS